MKKLHKSTIISNLALPTVKLNILIIRNYAKETYGLFARIIGKISAQTVLQYVNYVNGKPIGRIKYALN